MMRIVILTLVLCVTVQSMTAQVYPVIWKKTLWFDGKGEIQITGDAIEFRAEKEKASRRWLYQDIQHFDRISPREFEILSYEDQTLQLGRDHAYRFVITEGELSNAAFDEISRRLGKPVTNRMVDKAPAEARRLPVKHLHTFGGCEGELVIGENAAYYITDHAKDAREWNLDRDVVSIWARNRYQLELHVYENNRREFSKTRIFQFQLKKPLDSERYRELKLRLFDLRAEQSVIH